MGYGPKVREKRHDDGPKGIFAWSRTIAPEQILTMRRIVYQRCDWSSEGIINHHSNGSFDKLCEQNKCNRHTEIFLTSQTKTVLYAKSRIFAWLERNNRTRINPNNESLRRVEFATMGRTNHYSDVFRQASRTRATKTLKTFSWQAIRYSNYRERQWKRAPYWELAVWASCHPVDGVAFLILQPRNLMSWHWEEETWKLLAHIDRLQIGTDVSYIPQAAWYVYSIQTKQQPKALSNSKIKLHICSSCRSAILSRAKNGRGDKVADFSIVKDDYNTFHASSYFRRCNDHVW